MWHSLGKVTGGATPTRVTINETAPEKRVPCQTLFVQQLEANLGKIYICDRATADKTTLVGVLAIVPIPSVSDIGTALILPYVAVTVPSAPGALNAADFWVDFDNPLESCLISAVRN